MHQDNCKSTKKAIPLVNLKKLEATSYLKIRKNYLSKLTIHMGHKNLRYIFEQQELNMRKRKSSVTTTVIFSITKERLKTVRRIIQIINKSRRSSSWRQNAIESISLERNL